MTSEVMQELGIRVKQAIPYSPLVWSEKEVSKFYARWLDSLAFLAKEKNGVLMGEEVERVTREFLESLKIKDSVRWLQ